ncbi:MAG: uroporphyrinogen decarboxylase family protein [Bythopirellula sp.]
MHSSERVQKTLSHEEPDRVPMMFSGSRWVIERLKEHLGDIGPGVETDRQLMKTMGLDVWDTRGFDYRSGVGAKYIGPKHLEVSENWAGNHFEFFNYHEHLTENEYGPAYSMGKPCFGEEEYPGIEELEKFLWPQPDWFDYSTIRADLEPWAEDFAIAATGCSVFQHPTLYRGIEQLMYELEAEPEIAQYIVTKVTDFYYGYFEGVFEEAGDLIHILRLADDIGAQSTLFISPDNLSEFLQPHLKRCADLAHKYDIKLMFHTDGNVLEAIPELIEWGVDQLDPIQPEIPDMEAGKLKREFGDRLCFSGGIGSQEILPRGSVEEVQAEVKRVLDIMMPGGGYILSPGHPSLQLDVPPQNIAAMFAAGREYGKY